MEGTKYVEKLLVVASAALSDMVDQTLHCIIWYARSMDYITDSQPAKFATDQIFIKSGWHKAQMHQQQFWCKFLPISVESNFYGDLEKIVVQDASMCFEPVQVTNLEAVASLFFWINMKTTAIL